MLPRSRSIQECSDERIEPGSVNAGVGAALLAVGSPETELGALLAYQCGPDSRPGTTRFYRIAM